MKKVLRVFLVLLISVLIELIVFNGSVLLSFVGIESKKPVSFTLTDAQASNWLQEGETFVSEFDPQLVFTGFKMDIKDLAITAQMDRHIPYMELFYAIDDGGLNLDDIRLETGDLAQGVTITLNRRNITAVRLDLGDDPGLVLSNLTLTATPAYILSISPSRIIALNLIYWLTTGLFALQGPPKYTVSLPSMPGGRR